MNRAMQATDLLTALAIGIAGVTCVRVLVEQPKTALHWTLLSVLASAVIWTLGGILRQSASTPGEVITALRVLFFGVFFGPPLYFLLAARFVRIRAVEERPLASLVVLAPSLAAYLLLLTNEHHGLVMRVTPTVAARSAGPLDWAGPAFWGATVWIFACSVASIALHIFATRRAIRRQDYVRGVLLGLTAGIPVVIAFLRVFRLMPFTSDPIPSSVAIASSLLALTVVRYRLLDALPLARRDVIDQLRDGVLVCDVEGLILDGNAAAVRVLGAPIDALRALPIRDVLAGLAREEDQAAVDNAVLEMLSHDLPLRIEVRTPDERWIEVQAAPVSDRARGRAGAFAMLRDRTDEVRYERAVRQSQKLETVGTLVAGVAHEVNNPLAFLRANLGQLRRLASLVGERLDAFEEKQADELREFGDIVDESLDGIERISQVVDGMRRFSRIPRDEVAALDVNLAVRDAIRLADLHANRAVRVEARLDFSLPKVSGSSERLVQVLLNLLVNAKQAAGERADGRIAVETRLVRDEIEIRIADNGPGIPAEIQHRIFDPFFTTKDPDEGTGLGLAIAFDIVREHGGRIEVESEAGSGAVFRVHLPVRARRAEAATERSSGGAA